MNTTASKTADIRRQLKTLYKINSRQVSVRAQNYSLGSSIHIEINDPAIDIREVENVANKHKNVAICESTGEVLCGGNTHLFVKYSDDAAQKYAEAHADDMIRLMLGQEVEIDGITYKIDEDRRQLNRSGSSRGAWVPEHAAMSANSVARAILHTRAE